MSSIVESPNKYYQQRRFSDKKFISVPLEYKMNADKAIGYWKPQQ